MTKEEAKRALQDLGEAVHPSWTSVEIKSKLMEIKLKEEAETAGPPPLKGLHSMRKGELERLAAARGIVYTDSDTKGSLMRKLREHEFLNQPANGTDLMGFGKHASKTYAEVLAQDPQYVRWARETAMDGNSTPHLRRFAQYASNAEHVAVPMSPRASPHLVPPPASSAEAPTRKRRSAPPATPPATEQQAASSSSQQGETQEMMRQVMLAITGLNTRLSNLELAANPTTPPPPPAAITDTSDLQTENSFVMEDGNTDPAAAIQKGNKQE